MAWTEQSVGFLTDFGPWLLTDDQSSWKHIFSVTAKLKESLSVVGIVHGNGMWVFACEKVCSMLQSFCM